MRHVGVGQATSLAAKLPDGEIVTSGLPTAADIESEFFPQARQ